MSHGCVNVVLQHLNNLLLAYSVVFVAGVGSDGEARWHGHADEVHLGQVGTLAAESLAHLRIAFSLAVAEGVNSFCCHKNKYSC